MKSLVLAIIVALSSVYMAPLTSAFGAEPTSDEAKKSSPSTEHQPQIKDWHGFVCHEFTVKDRPALLVLPKKEAPGKPWIWRTEFFGHEPQLDIALLKQGYAVAYIDMQNMHGAPCAMEIMDAYYAYVRKHYKLADKAILEGFSRGGLFAFNWAAHKPAAVAALYVDAPVCDFTSWPGGKGKGPGSPEDWTRLLKCYNLTEDQALKSKLSPIHCLAPLAKAKIPIIAVVGDVDEVVPLAENMAIVEERYKKLGGKIEVIHKPDCKHHPHSLPDPAPIEAFLLKNTLLKGKK